MQNIKNFEKFVISQKGLLIRDGKALIMEMSKYPGKWDLPGGRVDRQENGDMAFKRELLEEVGVKEFNNLGVVHYHIWYLSDGLGFCGIVNLIDNNSDEITLSEEHAKFVWINENEIDNYKYIWPELGAMIKKGFEKYKLLK